MPTTTPQHRDIDLSINLTNLREVPGVGMQAECGYCGETIGSGYAQSWAFVIINHARNCTQRRPALPDRLTITEPRLSRVYLAWAVIMTTLFALLAIFGGH